jgi:hypothetical protein
VTRAISPHAFSLAGSLPVGVREALERAGVPVREQVDDQGIGLLDYEALEPAERVSWRQRLRAERRLRERTVVLARAATMASLSELLGDEAVMHVSATDACGAPEGLALTVTRLTGLRPVAHGVDAYVDHPTLSLDIAIWETGDIKKAASELTALLDGVDMPPRLRQGFLFAAVELLSNAVFNAPTDAVGDRPFAGERRTSQVQLNVPIILSLRGNERRIAFSVVDPFGSLHPDTVLAYLAKCLRHEGDQIDDKAGGAGLGLFLVLVTVSQLVFELDPGQRTGVISCLDLTRSYREFLSRAKSFDVFVAEHGGGEG